LADESRYIEDYRRRREELNAAVGELITKFTAGEINGSGDPRHQQGAVE